MKYCTKCEKGVLNSKNKSMGGQNAKRPDVRKKISDSLTGRSLSQIHRIRISKTKQNSGYNHPYITRQKISQATKTHWKSLQYRQKVSQAIKLKWQEPDYHNLTVSKILGSCRIKPNNSEKQLESLLENLYPGEWMYVGNGQLIISGKCPDFVNINGKKALIELFGNYWHSKEVTGRNPEEEENHRIKIFTRYGYSTLVIWESELSNLDFVSEKINNFNDKRRNDLL